MERCRKFNKSTGLNNHTGWKNEKNQVKVYGLYKSTESPMIADHIKNA